MAKSKSIYTCSFCGYQTPKWLGNCPDCDQWNTFYEETVAKQKISSGVSSNLSAVPLDTISVNTEDRISTSIGEFDRVLGTGLVRGAVVLIGGDPGIGKSTLLLQALTNLASDKKKVLYVTGEESLRQIRMRAERIGRINSNLSVLAETSLDSILGVVNKEKPEILVIDSVQTIFSAELDSAPGSVSQIREISAKIITYAKQTDTACFLVGHVTKEGAIAGPRVLEHMVDTVLYFEGDRGHAYRILRAVKNRFGSTDEIGVFEMQGSGLQEVSSPSELFIGERAKQSAGSAVVPTMEGTRPILVEIQALTAPTSLSMPRRTAIGIDQNRASVLVAVLEKKIGISLVNQDIFLNVAGGVRVNEPGIDLGIIAAIVSSKRDKAVPADVVLCGEVGLAGEVRGVSQVATRIRESERLGFTKCIVPRKSIPLHCKTETIEIVGVVSVRDAIDHIFH